MSATDGAELDLRGYLSVLSRRRVVAIATIAVVVGLTLLVSYVQEPVYAGKARVLLQPRAGESPFDRNTGQAINPDRALATEIEVVKGEGVRQEVRKALNGSSPSVSAHAVGATDVIEIVATSTSAQRAADVANAYADSYLAYKRKSAVEGILAAAKEIQASVTDIQRQVDALDAQVAAAPANQQQQARDAINAEKNSLVQQLGVFKQTLDQLQVDSRLRTGGAQLVGSARVPESPSSPKPVRNAVLAFFVGSFLAVGLAFLAEYLDDGIESQADLERLTGKLPVIGSIPAVKGWKTKDGPRLISHEDPKSPSSEAYRTLRTSIQFLALDRPFGLVQVTSPQAGDGKSTTLANLAVTLAVAGQRVLVVCCDLRRPRIHEFFGRTDSVGFTSVLLGKTSLNEAIQSVPHIPRLRLLAAGPLPPNPSELLSLARTGEVLEALRSLADIVLIDSPPILPVADALVLVRHVDATLMVFSALSTKRREAAMALARAQQVNAPLVGAVLNGTSMRAETAYGYGYSYHENGASEKSGKINGASVRGASVRDAAKSSSWNPLRPQNRRR